MPNNIADTIERVMSNAERARANAPMCDKHPEEVRRSCPPCTAIEVAEHNERNARDHKAMLAADCDKMFPRRYRCAVADDPQVLAWVESYLANPDGARGLLLMGQTGTGKTHQAYGALRIIANHTTSYKEWEGHPYDRWTRINWKATTHADLNASMRPGGDRDPDLTLLRNQSVEMLMVDDLAAARTSEWVEEHTYRLINGRYEDMRPSIFTTNLSPADLRDAVGDRIASRLVESCVRIVLDGPDRRRAGLTGPSECQVHADWSQCARPSTAHLEPVHPAHVPFDPRNHE